MFKSAHTDAERIRNGLLLVASRAPREGEYPILQRMLEDYRQQYTQDSQAAQSLLSVGESTWDESIGAEELAAWTMIASTLLNLDETLTK